ncbi:hypothetical protein PkP19E3_03800 [Pseudomonas koreensis]|nr:hypothetical protein PkP19E3_03800 [Pseudomonas koreensis]
MLTALLVFASILAGCVTALLLVIRWCVFRRYCWPAGSSAYGRILSENALDKKVPPEQPFSGSMRDFFFCQEYLDKQQIIFEFDLSGR